MNVAGVDFSTKAIDVVLLDEDTDAYMWASIPVEGRTPFDRAQDIRFAVPTASWWENHGVRLIAIEEPRGYGQLAMGTLYGAIVARLPQGIPAVPFIPQHWKKPFTGNGNASKEQVRARALEFGLGVDMPQDAYDAYGIAWVARELKQRAARSAA